MNPMIAINRRTLLTALAAAAAVAREAAADAGRSPLCRGPSDERDNRRHSAG